MENSYSILKNFFSTKGRMRRRDFGIIFIIIVLLRLVFSSIFSAHSYKDEPGAIEWLITLALLGILFIQAIKRCHDCNKSWKCALIVLFLPFIGGFYLLILRGTPGPNDYGDDPERTHYEL